LPIISNATGQAPDNLTPLAENEQTTTLTPEASLTSTGETSIEQTPHPPPSPLLSNLLSHLHKRI